MHRAKVHRHKGVAAVFKSCLRRPYFTESCCSLFGNLRLVRYFRGGEGRRRCLRLVEFSVFTERALGEHPGWRSRFFKGVCLSASLKGKRVSSMEMVETHYVEPHTDGGTRRMEVLEKTECFSRTASNLQIRGYEGTKVRLCSRRGVARQKFLFDRCPPRLSKVAGMPYPAN